LAERTNVKDPEGRRKRILEAALSEFAQYGYSGARIERIARAARSNKRSVYYLVGNKDELYLRVLEATYERIRAAERRLNLTSTSPAEAIARLISFTWEYFLENPEFIWILNTENLHRAKFLKLSTKVRQLHSPFVETIADILARGVKSGDFRRGVDPVHLYISIAGLSWFYLSNRSTLTVIFERNFMSPEARIGRLAHMTDFVLAALRSGTDKQLDEGLAPHYVNEWLEQKNRDN
jgi:AcrR family transcriptional regulator